MSIAPQLTLAPTSSRLWVPKQVLVTRSAAEQPHTADILARCEAAGVTEIDLLPNDRLTGLRAETERETYARAKNTLAVVVAPPSALKPQPIPPSADWRIDLARGCPAHCQYCYLAGSLNGPPISRVYANLDDVLAGIGTHAGRTRVRFSVNAAAVARRFEGGTRPTPARLAALRALAEAGYPVGLTIAPVMPLPGWEQEYGQLLDQVAIALDGVPDLDLTAEIITHRFTPASKEVLLGWYPQTKLEMAEDQRTQKRSKFGGVKYVYPRPVMAVMRSWFGAELARRLPPAQLLYWT